MAAIFGAPNIPFPRPMIKRATAKIGYKNCMAVPIVS
jgi:hypothetical protein